MHSRESAEKVDRNNLNVKKESSISTKSECIRGVRQRLACAITAQHAKKKSVNSTIELNEKLSERASNNVDNKRVHVIWTTSRSKHIVELFFIFYFVSLLQRRSIEELWRHQTTHEHHRFCRRREYSNI